VGELGTARKHGIVDGQTVPGIWFSQRSALSAASGKNRSRFRVQDSKLKAKIKISD
jgi:hypothetical protein